MDGLIALLGDNSAGLGSANTFTQKQTFSGDAVFNRLFEVKSQSIALNGASQTADLTAGSVVRVTGSTASSTVALPAAPVQDQLVVVLNEATVGWTLDGNGKNIDGSATIAMAAGYSRTIFYNGTQWESIHLTKVQADSLYGGLAAANAWASSNRFNGILGAKAQTVAATSTIDPTLGSSVIFSTGGITASFPASPTLGDLLLLKNNAASAVTLSGNGVNLDGSSTQSLPANMGALVVYNGAQWTGIGWVPWIVNTQNSAVTFSGTATMSGTATLNAKLTRGVQSFSTNGATQSIAAASGSKVRVTGSTASSIFNLPTASLTAEQEYTVINNASVSISVSGNGNNLIDPTGGSVASITMAANSRRMFFWNGTTWDVAQIGG